MSIMAKFIGGPFHGEIKQIHGVEKVVVPVFVSWNHPKQQRRGMFRECVYRRTRFVRDDQTIYRFSSGYYG